MGKCNFCFKEDKIISEVLNVCRDCIFTKDWNLIRGHLSKIHENVRKLEGLPKKAPSANNDIQLKCNFCMNECKLSIDDISYCGLRNNKKNQTKELPFPTKDKGYIHGYIDSNPTNCCNSWFCPAGTSAGFPQYSDYNGPEYGTFSYAAFLYGCSFNCLFCQNSSHKYISRKYLFDAESLANEICNNKKISCICYFGGTPEPQLAFTINLSELILKKLKNKDPDRKFRICWEWNGSGDRTLIEKCMEIAIKTGGNIKFDLKSYHEKLNYALCGVSNKRTLENFEYLATNYFGSRGNQMPEMSGCTLMVPEYINYEEVQNISKFISNINDEIPYSLLVFHGDYQMKDLPITPSTQAENCLNVAKKYLKNVHLGNKFLLNF